MPSKPKVIVILGPTSSGKSELAVKIAKKLNGEIISADSRQLYKGLNIGSGKITKKEMMGIPHHLLDIASPKKTFSVSQYQKLGQKSIKNILKRSRLPIICGGTGLYIDSLIYNYQFPNVPPQPALRKKLEKFSTEELFKKLQKLDPRRAQNIDKYNRRRLVRAIEIILTTKKPIPSLNISNYNNEPDYNIFKIGLNPSKEKLQKNIKRRIKKMIENGLLNEVKKLKKEKLSWNKICSFGFEYKYPVLFLQNKISKEEMIDAMLKENWRYAKRQFTWFKKDKNINWIGDKKEAIRLVKKFIKN